MIKNYQELPGVVNGYEQELYSVKFIRPYVARNLVPNPSFEVDDTDYSALGTATISRILTEQRRGVACLQVDPLGTTSDGVSVTSSYLSGFSVTAGSLYYLSFDLKGPAGVRFKTEISGTVLRTDIIATGEWQRVVCVYRAPTTTIVQLIIQQAVGQSRSWYLDGIQFEADRCTTYLDGSMTGLVSRQVAYYWEGAENASSSVRIQATRSGGQVVDLKDMGFRVMSIIGLGWDNFTNLQTENASIGGSTYNGSIQKASTFDLVGAFFGNSLSELMRNKSQLRALLTYDAGIVHQPLIMQIVVLSPDGTQVGETVEVECLFKDGLAGVRDNYNQERASLSFEIFKPHPLRLDGTVGGALERGLTVTGAYILRRINGEWFPFGDGMSDLVTVIVPDPVRGRIYVGGSFVSGDGVTLNHVGYWDIILGTFVEMDGGVNDTVWTIAVDAEGNAWVGGNFTAVGSGADATTCLARWNYASSDWTAFPEIQAAPTPGILTIAIAPNGRVIIGGIFNNWEGDAGSDNIAYTDDDGTNWNSFGTGADDTVNEVLVSADGRVYIAGAFQLLNGVTVNCIGYWNGTTAVTMNSALTPGVDAVYTLAQSPSGTLYAGGLFTAMGGITAATGIASWNGSAWSAMGSGLGSGATFDIHVTPDGHVWAVGNGLIIGGISTASYTAIWNGSAWAPNNVILPGTPIVYAVSSMNGQIYLGFSTTGAAEGVSDTSFTNPGSAPAYPTIVMRGEGTVVQLLNDTTGDVLSFDLVLLAGEKVVLTLGPNNIRFTSTFRGNILGTILPGSSLSTFRLVPGVNRLLFVITDDTVTTDAYLYFVPNYASLDDTLYS